MVGDSTKSLNLGRIFENWNVFDFEITCEDMAVFDPDIYESLDK